MVYALSIISVFLAIYFTSVIRHLTKEDYEALRQESGYLTSGGKFDVIVGSKSSMVPGEVARSGFKFYERSKYKSCLTHEYERFDFNVDIYSDDSWRKGTLCVVSDSSNDKIVALEWAFGPFKVEL
jgi:hypothetical protein